MPENAVVDLDVAEIAASSLALPRRAEQMLTVLRRLVPFDGAWLALADPQHPRYATAAAADLADSTLTFFTGPQQARDIEATGQPSRSSSVARIRARAAHNDVSCCCSAVSPRRSWSGSSRFIP